MAFCAYCGSHVGQVSYVPCASCGKPTNGAPPRPAGGTRGMTPLVIAIVVAGGGFFVLMVLGIVSAIAIPNFISAKERSTQKRTMTDMRTIGAVLEAYAEDKNAYPRGHAVSEIAPQLEPTYLEKVPKLDGWGNEIAYEALPNGGYIIASGGANRRLEVDSLAKYTPESTVNFDCDIVYSNGTFVVAPEGAKRD